MKWNITAAIVLICALSARAQLAPIIQGEVLQHTTNGTIFQPYRDLSCVLRTNVTMIDGEVKELQIPFKFRVRDKIVFIPGETRRFPTNKFMAFLGKVDGVATINGTNMPSIKFIKAEKALTSEQLGLSR